MNISSTVVAENDTPSCINEKLTLTERLIRYYEEAGMDYEHWSKEFNMHFGFYRFGSNPFDRESMLRQMNSEVADLLQLSIDQQSFLIDMGCGVGATARFIARSFPKTMVKGVTIVPWQVEKAAELNKTAEIGEQVEVINADYTCMPFENKAADGVLAIESSCHAAGAHKELFVRELARVLKTGGRFVIADCFIKRPEKKFNFLANRCYQAICQNWVLPEMASLDSFVATLQKYGLRDVSVRDVSWRIAPSVAHAPFAVTSFIVKNLLENKTLKPQSINNLKGSLLSLVLGMNRSKFSYCLISGRKG